jgi:ABC-2 type transport system ATP-binding protein
MSTPPAVRTSGVVKRYGAVTALECLDLEIPRGAFYALLGPNGAGKSTAISILTGVVAPDRGEVELFGLDAVRRPLDARSVVGVVPEELALFERLTGRQHLVFCGRMHGLDGAEATRRADELLEVTGLAAKAGELVATWSKGMRRRLGIAAALVHAPKVVLLDEPFEGIDVVAAGVVRELLVELSRRGVTLLLTTHVLEIADRLATHAGVLRAGRLVESGPVAELLGRHGTRSLEGVFEAVVGVPAARAARLSFYEDGEPAQEPREKAS